MPTVSNYIKQEEPLKQLGTVKCPQEVDIIDRFHFNANSFHHK